MNDKLVRKKLKRKNRNENYKKNQNDFNLYFGLIFKRTKYILLQYTT